MEILPMFRRRFCRYAERWRGGTGAERPCAMCARCQRTLVCGPIVGVHRASAIEIDHHRRGHPAVDAEWTLF